MASLSSPSSCSSSSSSPSSYSSSSSSSSSCQQNVSEEILKVPHEFMEFPLGFVIDAGGSVTKILYRSKVDYRNGKLMKPSDHGLLRLRYFNMVDIGQIVNFLKENCDVIETGRSFEEVTWLMTGVTTQHFKAKLEKEFGIKTKLYSEMMSLQSALRIVNTLELGYFATDYDNIEFAAKVIRLMVQAIEGWSRMGDTSLELFDHMAKTDDEDGSKVTGTSIDGLASWLNITEPSGTEPTSKVPHKHPPPPKMQGPVVDLLTTDDVKRWSDKYLASPIGSFRTPFILVLFGSASVTLLVDDELKMKAIDFIGAAGKSLCGLVEEMLGVKDFNEFMEMAEKGNSDNVTTMVADLRNDDHTEKDWYSMFPGDAPAFELGKLSSGNPKGKGTYSKEDLAAGIMSFHAKLISKIVLLNCRLHRIETVYLCGSLVNFAVARRMIERCFLTESMMLNLEGGPLIKIHFLNYPGFLVGLGVWATNVELTKSLKDKK